MAQRPPDPKPADVNFASIVSLNSLGGWHVLRLSLDGSVLSADPAAKKVLRQFFADEPDRTGALPAALIQEFLESRDWGTRRSLSRTWRRFAITRHGLQLTAHFIPDTAGGYLVLSTAPASATTKASALPLTDREQEVVMLVAAGKTNFEVGMLLHISARTVQKHLENIFRKLGVETRTALATRVFASTR